MSLRYPVGVLAGEESAATTVSEMDSDAPRRRAGYARRRGVEGDIRILDSQRVIGITFDGRPFNWKRGPEVELLEFGSFNPANDNYMEGGQPWTG